MKKFLLAALVFVGSLGVANAQEIASKGTSMVNLGIGLGYRFGGSMSVPPLSVAYDYSLKSGLIDGNGAITLGGYLAYTSANYSYLGAINLCFAHCLGGTWDVPLSVRSQARYVCRSDAWLPYRLCI